MSKTSKAQLVITALFTEHQTPAEVATRYGVHRSWVYKLKARYEAEGETALQPRSRRPKNSPDATDRATVDLILELRERLANAGLDAGPDTIGWHLEHHHQTKVSRATISRQLTKAGLVVPEPKKRPKSSYIRFQATMPNETWQSDLTHYPLTNTDGTPGLDTEIITWLDDCSRYVPSCTAKPRITTPIVLATFRKQQVSTASPPPRSPTTAWSTRPASPAPDAREGATPSRSSFGPLFLPWVAVLGLSIYALVGGLATLDVPTVKAWFAGRALPLTAWTLMVLAALFALLWLSEIVPGLLAGRGSTSAGDYRVPTNPVHVLDLAIFLPAVFASGVLLLRKDPLGYATAPSQLVFLALTCMPIMITPLVADARGHDAGWAVVPPIGLLLVGTVAVLWRTLRDPTTTPGPDAAVIP